MWGRTEWRAKWGAAVGVPLLVGCLLIFIEEVTTDQQVAVVPVPVAATSGGSAARQERLQVVDVAVVPVTVTQTLRDEFGSVQTQPERTHAIDVAVRNTGEAVSVIDRIELRIERRLDLESCAMEGGPVEISRNYSILVMKAHRPDTILRHVVRHAVAPNGVERFQITLGPPGAEDLQPGSVMQLQVRLFHDDDDMPLEGGPVVVVAVPLFGSAVDKAYADDPACVDRNLAAIRHTRDWRGVRSPELDAIQS